MRKAKGCERGSQEAVWEEHSRRRRKQAQESWGRRVRYVGGHQSSAAGTRERQEIAGEVREVMESQRAWGLFGC